jgi:hypothetical protein
MNLVIDRKRWLRGEGAHDSKLLRPSDGKMCCLGFYGLACGLSADQICGAGSPRTALGGLAMWPAWMRMAAAASHLSDDAADLMEINDDVGDESRIAAIFAKHGVTVRFVDEPEGE